MGKKMKTPVYPYDIFPNRLTDIMAYVAIVALLFSIIMAVLAWFYPHKFIGAVYLLVACWAILPPIWFWFEYFRLYRIYGDPSPQVFELFKHGQQVSVAIWAGVAVSLGAYASSEHFKNLDQSGKTSRILYHESSENFRSSLLDEKFKVSKVTSESILMPLTNLQA